MTRLLAAPTLRFVLCGLALSACSSVKTSGEGADARVADARVADATSPGPDSGIRDASPPEGRDSGPKRDAEADATIQMDGKVEAGPGSACGTSAVRCVLHERQRCSDGDFIADVDACPQGCDNETAECLPTTLTLTHGIASGEVTDHSAVIWTRTAQAADLEVAYGTDPNRLDLSARGRTEATRDFTAQVELTDLEPATSYYYRVYPAGGARSEIGRFNTAPSEASDVTFVLSADVADVPTRFTHFDRMGQVGADAWFTIGDFPYADAASDLAGYRAIHGDLRRDPHLIDLFKSTSVYAMFDDHEVANNFDGAFRETQPARVEAGLRAWSEWFPLSRQAPDAFYRRYRWGAVEVFLLDTRSYRDARSKPDGVDGSGVPTKTMLGAAQRDWLLEAVGNSTAEFKLIISPVPLDFDTTNGDAWSGYRNEREALMYAIVQYGIQGVVVVSGDQHWFAAHHHRRGLKELQLGPITADVRTPPLQRPYPVVMRRQRNGYGVVRYEAAQHQLVLEAWGVGSGAVADELLYREIVPAGRGVLRVESSEAIPFSICPSDGNKASCTHAFEGTAPAVFSMASPGVYEAQFGSIPGYDIANVSGTLVAGGELILRPVLVPRDEPLPWYEPFDSAVGFRIFDEGGIESPSAWSIASGTLLQSSNIYDELNDAAVPKLGTIALKGDPQWTDYSVSVWFQSQDDDGVGLLARATDASNYYRFSVDRQRRTARLVQRVNGAFTLLAEVTGIEPYAIGRWTQLGVSVKGDQIMGYINGAPVINAQSSALSHGAVGLYSWGSKGVRFDAMKVSATDTPRIALPYSDPFTQDRGLVVVDQGNVELPSRWSFSDGTLLQTSNIHDTGGGGLPQFGTLAFTGDPSWTDYEVSVSTLANDDDSLGLLARVKDDANYYRFSIDQQRRWARIVAVIGGEATMLAEQVGFSFSANQAHRIAFGVSGDQLTASIDGQVVLTAEDDRLERGAVGLYSWGMNSLRFDDLRVE